VLVAEDDAGMRGLLATYFNADGRFALVAMARDGEEAVLLAVATRPDVIVLDIGLPLRSGIEALQELRSRGLATPAVFYTAQPEFTNSALVASLGAEVAGKSHMTPRQLGDLLVQLADDRLRLDIGPESAAV
jgi:two-component system OmpR family response regulator